jgi:uncharacterized membrane protein YbhN (UPF0104 family)
LSDGSDAVAGIDQPDLTSNSRAAPAAPLPEPQSLPSDGATETDVSTPSRAVGRLRRWWPTLRVVIGFVLAGVALWVVYDRGSELQASRFEHLRWIWLVPAVLVEGASLVSFALMQARLLSTGKVEAPAAPLTGVTFASQAISNSFPGGAALAMAYSFRWYRRFGADDSLAGWTIVGVLIGASLSLSLVAAGGVVLAADASADLDLVPAIIGVLLLSILTAILFVKQEWVLAFLQWVVRRRRARREARAARAARAAAPPLPKARRRTGVDLSQTVMRVLDRLGAFRLGWRGLATVVGFGLGTWLLDCTCFALAFLVVRAPIPWGALLLAYGAGQLAVNVPITPGGLGVVEGSITAALVLFGGANPGTVEAVFVYRLISFWLELMVGWSWAGFLAIGVRRGRWPVAVPGVPPIAASAGAAAAEAPR